MVVLTVLTDLDDWGFNRYLKPTCNLHNLDLVVLEYPDRLLSYRIKDALLLNYLDRIDDNEIILFTDGTDTAFVSGANEILDKFLAFNAPLIFSAEVNCWPDSSLKNIYPGNYQHFRYLNSGAFIGTAGYLKDIYRLYPITKYAINDYRWSNQYYWNLIYMKEHLNIKLDNQCSIFYNMSTYVSNRDEFNLKLKSYETRNELFEAERARINKEISFYDKRIKCHLTNSDPCHLHFPGPISKQIMSSGFFESILQ